VAKINGTKQKANPCLPCGFPHDEKLFGCDRNSLHSNSYHTCPNNFLTLGFALRAKNKSVPFSIYAFILFFSKNLIRGRKDSRQKLLRVRA